MVGRSGGVGGLEEEDERGVGRFEEVEEERGGG